MREERGQISGDVVVYEPFTLWGSIGGNVSVIQGGKFYLRGSVYGDLSVEYRGRVHIYGNLTGNLTIVHGAKVIHSGIIGGDVLNDAGRLYVDAGSKIIGKIKTKNDGQTTLDPKYKPSES
ncbi:MAG TPA: hypothetical protein VGF52_01610 [Tepidisphaeraceae bacterium]|jgi:cytoskeletal protein CcmA (bactofilin family)